MRNDDIKQTLVNNSFNLSRYNIIPLCSFAVLFLLILLSLYSVAFVYITTIVAILYIILVQDKRASFVVFFLIPLINLFSVKNGSFNLLAIIFGVLVVKLFIIYAIKICKKKLTINWFNLICICLLCLCVFGLSFSAISKKFGIIMGIVFLFLMQIYSKEIDIKDISIYFLLGLVSAIIFGFLKPTSARLTELVVTYSANGFERFSGVSNPNFLAGELVFCFSLFTFLFINKNIGKIYYLVTGILLGATLLTLSKSGLIMFILVIILTSFFMLIKYKGSNKLEILLFLSVVSLVFICFSQQLLIILGRYAGVTLPELTPPPPTTEQIPINKAEGILGEKYFKFEEIFYSNNLLVKLNNLTTGRFVLWLQFIIGTCLSVKTLLLGFGVGASDHVAIYNGVFLSAHNTFIQFFYYFGLVGIVVLLVTLISCFYKKKFKQFNVLALMPILAIFMFMFFDSLLSYRLCIFLYLVWVAMNYSKKQIGENKYEFKTNFYCNASI